MKTSASGNVCHGALFALACLALLVLPGSAAAKLDDSAFTLHATNGYQIRVFGGDEGSATRVSLAATRGDSFAEYSVKGTITPTKIKASFGRLGLISLRFHPSGRVRRV